MLRYKKLDGVTADPSAQALVTTPEGRAMGHVPGWVMLLDPDYLVGANAVRNRALRDGIATNDPGAVPLDAFDNDEAAFAPTQGSLLQLRPDRAAFDPESWSYFTVGMVSEASGVLPRLVSPVVEQGDVLGPYIVFYETGYHGVALYEGSGAISPALRRINAAVRMAERTSPALLMFTFSTRDGLKIFVDGELSASNPDDKRPLDFGYQAGTWELFRGMRGQWGMTGVLNIDLGWPEHAGYRRSIERFLMNKYGIT